MAVDFRCRPLYVPYTLLYLTINSHYHFYSVLLLLFLLFVKSSVFRRDRSHFALDFN